MTGEHYYTAEPAVPAHSRQITIEAGGRALRLEAASGVFSASRIDPGTALLLRKAPPPAATGNLLDLGCGYGPIALSLAVVAPGATVYAVDVNRRALDLVRRNAEANGLGNVVAVEPDGVDPALRFAQIWSNPPIRVGKEELHGMLNRWLPRLETGGSGWLVVARHLGADSLQGWLGEQGWPARREASGKGYRIFEVKARDGAVPGQHNL